MSLADHMMPASCRYTVAVIMVLVCVGVWAVAASANLGTPHVIPPEPTESDSVRISIAAGFGDGCWYIADHECVPADADSMEIHVYAVDLWQPGWICPAGVWSVDIICEYGQLAVGQYTATFREHRESLRYPDGDTRVMEFEVRPNTSVEHVTWGRIRALYRP